jgi:hypothetical protein
MLQCRRLYAIGLDARRLVVANCWNASDFPAVQWSREPVTRVTAKAVTLTTIDDREKIYEARSCARAEEKPDCHAARIDHGVLE